jgi:DNA-binding transcriptional MerR regulator
MSPMPRRPSVRPRKSNSRPAPKRTEIPDRGLKIGEAARALGVETYVLRFWETQFPFLKPKHSRTKHRFYQERYLEVLRLIKRLLHDEGFTIAGANKHIKENSIEGLLAGRSRPAAASHAPAASSTMTSSGGGGVDGQTRRVLSEVRRDLETIQKILED